MRDGNGTVRDPLNSQEITWDKSLDRGDQWHMGHKPGYEFRKHQVSAAQREIGIEQFRNEFNTADHVWPELPENNLSHAGENHTDDYFGH